MEISFISKANSYNFFELAVAVEITLSGLNSGLHLQQLLEFL
ncbi:hypothetical protein [Methanotorris igneus]|nr:hypothetical protein [Methanotorris igneus]